MRKILIAALLPLLAGGCLRTVATVATAPVKVASKTVDWTTTSQSEADRNYGRKVRKQEERDAKARRQAYKDCRRDGREDCDRYAGR
ncbi:hypothetical protein [Sphingomonas immobilis]|uniref:Lipoprotein n=1 Tax=Sphingomonas immobilis TaxID=3063997 RepID=A0ABT9A0F2_9SPHN|nr:hypothetical protein [Sphingomonas sp. CA1-15]MDO7843311.1 hypothetical protein [Sphingomonas sp. CA1-15]